MKITAKTRKGLNNCPALRSLNNGNPMTYSRYIELYNQLQDEVNAQGLSVMGVTHIDKSVECTERRRHELHVNGTEDEIIENCVFCVSIYNYPCPSEKLEFTGYFS